MGAVKSTHVRHKRRADSVCSGQLRSASEGEGEHRPAVGQRPALRVEGAAAIERNRIAGVYVLVWTGIGDWPQNGRQIHGNAECVVGKGDFLEQVGAGARVVGHHKDGMRGDRGRGPGDAQVPVHTRNQRGGRAGHANQRAASVRIAIVEGHRHVCRHGNQP